MLVGAGRRRSAASVVAVSITITIGVACTSLGWSSEVAAGSACASGPTYAVRSGDGWFAIADRVDVSVDDLLDANDADVDDVLLAGDLLCLPVGADIGAACGSSYTVRSGDGWFAIADRVDAAVRSLLGANGADLTDSIHPGEVLCLPSGATSTASSSPGDATGENGTTYTVALGDSWFDIARRASTSMQSLLAANGASTSTVIVPGQSLRLPSGASRPASTSTPSNTWVDLEALPIQGPCGYGDTWHHARSGGRAHVGTDMFTISGNYVYAVVDGRLTDRDWDQPGRISGNAWTLAGGDGTTYYYAHLADFNPALGIGSSVRAGEIIGWLGSSGNASAPHLHFEIRPGGGAPINPYPILRAEGGCHAGTPYTQPGGWVPDRIG